MRTQKLVEEQRQMIAQQQRDIEALKNKKRELLSDVDAARATVSIIS